MRNGIQVALITGRHSEIVLHRAMELGVSNVYENVIYKGKTLVEAAQRLGIPMEAVAFMGMTSMTCRPLAARPIPLPPRTRRLR